MSVPAVSAQLGSSQAAGARQAARRTWALQLAALMLGQTATRGCPAFSSAWYGHIPCRTPLCTAVHRLPVPHCTAVSSAAWGLEPDCFNHLSMHSLKSSTGAQQQELAAQVEALQGPQGALAEAELALLGVETSTGSILYDEFRHGPLAPLPQPMTSLPFHACCMPRYWTASVLGHAP